MLARMTLPSTTNQWKRRGNIVALAAAMLVMIFAFVAFVVDVGYITLVKAQLQATADASALAGAQQLAASLSLGPTMTVDEAEAASRAAAVDVAANNQTCDREAVFAHTSRDVRFGRYEWEEATGTWLKVWDVPPYNMVEVSLKRNQQVGASDGPLSLFFAPLIGHTHADTTATSTAALIPGSGFRIRPGSGITAGVLPITLDDPTWTDLVENNIGSDNYTYNDDGTISNGPDGILEVDLYPYGKQKLPPGNRGTVDFGSNGNSTADIKRQILYGLSEDDLSYFGGQLSFANGPLSINGDTGISAGIKAQLEQIKGQPRAIPIFTDVSGNGNNAYYTIIKFVGIRIMNVKLTGNPKRVVIQPAPFVDSSVISHEDGGTISEDAIYTPGRLIP